MPAEFVLDASVAVKCFITEPGSDLARRLAESGAGLVAPDLIFVELASVAAKRVARGDIPSDLGARLVERAPDLLDQVFPIRPLARQAFDLAQAAGVSAYDGLYLALAQVRGVRLVTADAKLVRKAAEAGLAADIVDLAAL